MPKESKKMTFHIEGMHCVSCSILINKILGKEKGVNAVNANFGSEMLAVDFDEKIISIEEIKKIVGKLGYSLISNEKSDDSFL